MRLHLGIHKKIRCIYAYLNLLRFRVKKSFLGFDVANLFTQRVDKRSLVLILKKNGAKIGKNCDIETGIVFHNCKDYSNLCIGDNSHIGKNCFFDLRDKIDIGNNVTISMQCSFTTHQDMGKSFLDEIYGKTQKPIIITDNVYIGINSTILQGVIIGKKSIIAAGSVVKDNVLTKIIAGGVPAKLIKKLN